MSTQATMRCAVRGSINNDEYFYVTNISQPGQTISSHHYECRVGGKGANQAVAIARASGRGNGSVNVDFYGCIGKKDGTWTREKMVEWGLDGNSILVVEEPTGRAIIQVADDGENSIVLFPGANHTVYHELGGVTANELSTTSKLFSSQIVRASPLSSPQPNFTHLLLQNEIDFSSTLYALSTKTHLSKIPTIIWNPSPSPTHSQFRRLTEAKVWQNIDWLIVNEGEAENILDSFIELAKRSSEQNIGSAEFGSGSPRKDAEPIEATLRGLADIPILRTTNIICTLGARGLLAHLPSYPVGETHNTLLHQGFVRLPTGILRSKVVDTTGAGDCFTGYFVCGLMEVESEGSTRPGINGVLWALRFAAQAAAMCVEKEGTIDSIPFREEVEEVLNGST